MTFGAIFYRGPSLLTGDPIVGVLTGLSGESLNPKTGPMVQAWLLRLDRPPTDAVRAGADDAICGTCALRGEAGRDRKCYVTTWLGPHNVWKSLAKYVDVGWDDLRALVEGQSLRLCAYGDPAAVPFEIWKMLIGAAGSWTAYTHAWRTCDPRLKAVVMASVDTEDEFHAAHLAGWRTFRVRRTVDDPVLHVEQRNAKSGISKFQSDDLYRSSTTALKITVPLEFVCPASDEGGHRSTCARCLLCRGTSSPARSVVIAAHGKPSTLKAYGLQPMNWLGTRGPAADAEEPDAHVVCAACAEDFAPDDEQQRICTTCLALGWAERLCVGSCGRTIVSDGRRTRCVDCQLAHQRTQFSKRVARKRDAAEVASV